MWEKCVIELATGVVGLSKPDRRWFEIPQIQFTHQRRAESPKKKEARTRTLRNGPHQTEEVKCFSDA